MRKMAVLLLLPTLGALQLQGCSSPLKYEPSAREQGGQSQAPQVNQRDGSCAGIYVVQPGDSLIKIAQKCDVPLSLLQEVNQIARADLIYVNQELRIPNAQTASKAQTPKEASVSGKVLPPVSNSLNWVWPMNEQTEYQFVRDENGVSALEVYGFIGQQVFAMADGEVVFAGDGISEYGNMVMLRHADGKLSVYAHNQSLDVQKGDQVKAGQPIAKMGASGLTNRAKLYAEVRFQGQKISIKQIFQN
ncbi:MAG: peptidoglycan DD-metalloendopeptidase family protein [Thiotrichales bacterium]|nr:peptidoglycan DD-metalloendopeptidase family protein [Thiotrichales bacterium]